MKGFPFLLLFILSAGCTASFSISSDVITMDIPITGYSIPGNATTFTLYGEGCMCFDPLPEGVVIDSVIISGFLVNNTQNTMDYEIRLSTVGNTDCGEDTVYFEYTAFFDTTTDKPNYIDEAELLVSGSISPGERIPFNVQSTALKEGLYQGRVWGIVKNVSNTDISSFGDTDNLQASFTIQIYGKIGKDGVLPFLKGVF